MSASAGEARPASQTGEVRPALRALGIDLGTRRIGVALSDSAGLLATPYEVVARSGDEARDHRRLAQLAEEAEALRMVVGYPLSLDGGVGPAARAVAAEAQRLRSRVNIPVELFDERLTTVTADRALRAQGVRGPARRKVIDQLAAAVILGAWLDSVRDEPQTVEPTGETEGDRP